MMTPLPSTRPEDPSQIESRMRIVGDIVARSPVPVFLSSNTCLDVAEYPRRLLTDNGLFLLPGAHLAMAAIGHVTSWVACRERVAGHRAPVVPQLASRANTDVPGPWAEDEGRALLAAAGVPMVPAELVGSADEAVAAASRFAGPVAMKICSREIQHKSDMGGVRLGVAGEEAVRTAFADIMAAVRRMPDAVVRGVLVSPMRPPGLELLVGVTVDPTFGPVLAVALGGVWVEVLKDTSLRVLPVDAGQVREMLDELRGASLLRGARGSAPLDLDALGEVILRISQAALTLGDALDALEVNPLRVSADGIEGLDVLVNTAKGTDGAGDG
jgi:acyl-CoA synthetase (NDP forming)